MGSSLSDLRDCPDEVKDEIGKALLEVQFGKTPRTAKPLKGFGGASVLEIVEDFNTDTYRAIYTVRFKSVVYVLHTFKKKSRHGRATPRADIELVRQRLLQAETHYQQWQRDEIKGE